MRLCPAVVLVPAFLLLNACANTSQEPAFEVAAPVQAERKREPLPTPPTADARPFYPSEPAVRMFAYSRIAPDGSKVVGNLGLAVLNVGHTDGEEPRLLMAAAVHFRANAVIFSSRQARAFHPDGEWPDAADEYPLAVKDIAEDYAFISAMPQSLQADPEALVLFWTRGMLSYIGQSTPPSGFRTISIDEPDGELSPFCVRGVFTDDARPAGTFMLTFRKDSGLTSISGVLPDGTIITLIERMPFELEREVDEADEEGEQVDVEWDGQLVQALRPAR